MFSGNKDFANRFEHFIQRNRNELAVKLKLWVWSVTQLVKFDKLDDFSFTVVISVSRAGRNRANRSLCVVIVTYHLYVLPYHDSLENVQAKQFKT